MGQLHNVQLVSGQQNFITLCKLYTTVCTNHCMRYLHRCENEIRGVLRDASPTLQNSSITS